MKIAILTQPFHNNYGGLLQAYALQKVLKDMGHQVITVWMKPVNDSPNLFVKTRSVVYRLIARHIFKEKILIRAWPSNKEKREIAANTQKFVKEFICTTQKKYSVLKPSTLEKFGFEAIFVGSDQVWRPKYSPNIFNFFLDFAENKKKLKRIAYAASFGVDNWEYSNEQTKRCARLAKLFSAISVREDSGVQFCQKHLIVNAHHVLDPTMLLPKLEYMMIAQRDNAPAPEGKLLVYFLDKSTEQDNILNSVSKRTGLRPFEVMPKNKFSDPEKESIKDCVFRPVSLWLRWFLDAEFVITDSFHGVLFSVHFNKPFIAVRNTSRGEARINSFLKSIALENRLVSSSADISETLLCSPIDWASVYAILSKKREQSLRFITNALGN